MKALVYDRYGPPEVLSIRDVPQPEPGRGEVLVQVSALPVGPGDCKLRAGQLREHFEVEFPKIPGRYAAGTVVVAGTDVETALLGRDVVLASLHGSQGTAAEYVACPAARLAQIPAGLGHIGAAALIQGGVTAWACLVGAARIEAGERVLVHGAAGAVGSACIEIAVHRGAIVSATCRASDADFVRGLGASAVHPFDEPGAADRVRDMDVVIDTVGGDAHARSYAMLRPGGRLVTLKALPIVDRGAEHGIDVIPARIDDRVETLEAVMHLAGLGVLAPRIAGVLPLERAAEAHALVETGAARRGRVVLQLCAG